MTNKNYLRTIFKGFLLSTRTSILLFVVLLCSFALFSAYGAKITYSEDTSDFPNPERGFWGGTVFFKYLYINTYGDLSSSFLDGLEKTFNDTRNSKKKIVPRFRYNNGDAPLDAMLKQIEQLRPIFERNYDVIAVLEAGFVGAYGEWHSSPSIKTADARRQVLLKILDVLPRQRMVALRYNYYKREIFDSDEPITIDEAFNESDKSRVGAHNDCFVTNEHDAGTYHETNWENGLGYEAEKDYLSADNLYVPQMGETCQVGSVSYASCDRALADMERMRWDMIQTGWYEPVLDQWENQGCWNEISRRLGYRIVLIDATFDDEVTDGNLHATLRLKNVGFGKIYNPRKCEMVLRNTGTGKEYTLPINKDPRFWSPGREQTLNITIPIPEAIPFGTYSLFLNLPDPAPKLNGIPEYSIRLANKDVWQSSKGYNSLKHNVKISSHNLFPLSVKNSISSERISGITACDVTSGKEPVGISFNNSGPARVRIDVYDLSGSLVSGLVDQNLGTGAHTVTWNRRNRSGRVQGAGVYFVSFRSEGFFDTRQVILRK